ncbi:caldesmon isoform X6 [Protopterus annectens]|uniref:caldesmon isoform X6 n=1 Tax=Protopterus annectens TaxID=7888 RepID=UPI001CFBEF36|nr:caldesmon isoform X6 [Protopterus annectens]
MDDFERRRELRRQKREEMRMEVERLASQRNEDDEEEAARERRRRARQERLRQKEEDDTPSHITDKMEVHVQNSMTEETKTVTSSDTGSLDDEAFLERLAKREERRQKRQQEALERQKELDVTVSNERPSSMKKREEPDDDESMVRDDARQGRYGTEKVETKVHERNDGWQRDEEEEEEFQSSYYKKQDEEAEDVKKEVPEETQSSLENEELEEEKALREKEEEEIREREEQAAREREEREARAREEREREREEKAAWERDAKLAKEREEKAAKKDDIKLSRGYKQELEEAKLNGEDIYEGATDRHKQPERTPSRPSMKLTTEVEEADDTARLEAERKLEILRRRRDETESEEFERLKQKQQEAAAELEELKRKREERRKILEEEEQRRKQEEAEKKTKEEEEKRRMKEEIERRRAEAAEKRQKVTEDGVSPDTKKSFTCVSPRASSLKIGERAEFLNRSAQRSSSVKTSHPPAVVISKIDSKLEQYTSAIEGTRATKPGKPVASDLPVPIEGVRNITSMWEKGRAFTCSSNPSPPHKETATVKIGVSSRINEWMNKTPESTKSPSSKPLDLRPGDVSGKRNIWENKATAAEKFSPSAKVTTGGKTKSVSNAGMEHYENEP